MAEIHKTAIIEGDVKLAEDVSVGPYSILVGNIEVGEGTEIGSHVRIEGNVTIGKENKIASFAYIGAPPQDLGFKGEISGIKIGNNNIIREYVTIHRATGENNYTLVGDNNFIMAYAHLAHNVKLGSECIIVNAAQLAGYVEVHDKAFVSGLVGVHQFVRIGGYSIIGGVSRVTQDVLPFMMVVGVPPRVTGINLVGLRRNGFTRERIKIIKEAYKILYRSGLNLSNAVEKLKNELPMNEDIKYILEFMNNSRRGILLKAGENG